MKPNFKVLDGLRGIAALYVVINHCRGNMLMGGSDYANVVPAEQWSVWDKIYYAGLQFTSLGTEFVVLFFVLSGFSISHSLRKNPDIFSFYKRRLIRIYPPFLLALFWAFGVHLIIHSSNIVEPGVQSVFHDFESTIKNLIYIPCGHLIPQFWSLSHEVIFYFLAPLILFKRLNNRVFTISIFILYISSFIFAQNETVGDTIIERFIFDYSIFFILGITLHRLISEKKYIGWIEGKWKLFLAILVLVPVMIIVKFQLGEDNRITPILAAILSIFLIVNFLRFDIKWNLLSALGRMSYTLYISHFASIYLMLYVFNNLGWIENKNPQEWYIWIVGVFGCILFAIPFYLIVEKPTKNILAKLRKEK